MSPVRIRLVAIDLDGTLLTSAKQLAPEGRRWIEAAARAGVQVVLASTRNPDIVQSFCRQLALSSPMICSNGAQVWGSPDGPAWVVRPISRPAALEIACLADTQGWELSTTVGVTTYKRQRPGQALGPAADNICVVPLNVDAIVGEPVRILTWTPAAWDRLRQVCQEELSEFCYAETFFNPDGTVESVGIFALGADKGKALQLVLDRLGFQPQQALAIGDNFVDVPMFACAGTSVALANAPEAVKQKATVVGPSNDEEGVAWALKKYLFGYNTIQA